MHIEVCLPPTGESVPAQSHPLLDLLCGLSNVSWTGPSSAQIGAQHCSRLSIDIAIVQTQRAPSVRFTQFAHPLPDCANSSVHILLEHKTNAAPRPAADILCEKRISQITIAELAQITQGRLLNLNHAGINFDPDAIDGHLSVELHKMLAQSKSAIYYPGRLDWLFIMANHPDQKIDARRQDANFELVLEKGLATPLMHFDIQTSLSRHEAVSMFPEPVGFAIPGLENFFRSVVVRADWSRTLMRIDLRFLSSKGMPSFNDWLIKEGRILCT